MARFRNTVIIANLILLLAFVAWSVAQKERTLDNGQLVLLELAPVDPRSLMQGDYMVLRYSMAPWANDSLPDEGFYVLQLDEHRVGSLLRKQPGRQPLNEGELIIRYKQHGSQIGAESFFFEEGSAERFEKARYGGLRVDSDGNSILTGLYDENFRLITPSPPDTF